jgi:hypothetical protein
LLTSVRDKKNSKWNAIILTAQRLKNAKARFCPSRLNENNIIYAAGAACAVRMTAFRFSVFYPELTFC